MLYHTIVESVGKICTRARIAQQNKTQLIIKYKQHITYITKLAYVPVRTLLKKNKFPLKITF